MARESQVAKALFFLDIKTGKSTDEGVNYDTFVQSLMAINGT